MAAAEEIDFDAVTFGEDTLATEDEDDIVDEVTQYFSNGLTVEETTADLASFH